jgi:hypothetical protein
MMFVFSYRVRIVHDASRTRHVLLNPYSGNGTRILTFVDEGVVVHSGLKYVLRTNILSQSNRNLYSIEPFA